MTKSNAIQDGSVGFLDRTGNIKSKSEELETQKKLESAQTQESKKSSEASSADIESNTAQAFSNVRKRTNEDVSQIADVINTDEANLVSSNVNLKELKQTAIELKQAIKSGDTSQIDSLKSKFSSLQNEQREINKQIENDNISLAPERSKEVRVGNKSIGRIETEAPKPPEPREVDVADVDSLNKFISATSEDIGQVKQQLTDNREQKDLTKELATVARAEINQTQENVLNDIKDADALARKTSNAIKDLGANALNLVHGQVSRSAVENLLR